VLYPALDVGGVDDEFLLALVDDFRPSAVESHDSHITIYFPDRNHRDEAREAIARMYPDALVLERDVDDEDWARRSQENLTPITVGRITVAPSWTLAPDPKPLAPDPITLVIAPSMGFGTGHHATTRLCLRALQELDLIGSRVLDVGTGSGVLALASRLLGASEVLGIDDDPDAIQSAIENLARNPGISQVQFEVKDLRAGPLPRVDVITANLTGALLVRSADLLWRALAQRGSLIVSGLQSHERDDVVAAFGGARVGWEATEDEWVGLLFRL
jgi:ribosomal protein L11 methyltransferase